MPELKGSKTEANLMTAFAGESQAHTKYQYYASAAKRKGSTRSLHFFEETAATKRSTPKSGSSCCTTECRIRASI